MRACKRYVGYLGFGLYWSWVYLSFNSLQITGTTSDGTPLIPVLHIVSGLTGCAAFVLAIIFHARIERSPHFGAMVWMAAAVTMLGTLFYALPLVGGNTTTVIVGAVISGFASPWLALAWGLAFCRLDARLATGLTAGSFLTAGVLYVPMSFILEPFSGALLAFMPVLSALLLYFCDPERFTRPTIADAPSKTRTSHELATMLVRTGSGRIITGIFLTMFVCGGLRIYIMRIQSSVYADPFLVALPIVLVALAFLAYSRSISHTSLNLGPFYRIAMPLFALAFAVIAISGGSTDISFLIVSAGSTLIDMLTWVLLIEIARSTHYPALLVMAVGRLAIHLGMALGESTALFAFSDMTVFLIVSIVLLMLTTGFMFTDRDTTFFFEPPTKTEIAPAQDTADDIDSRIRRIAETYGLSPRETEVFTLWAGGYGSKAIEEKLVVSSSTVKTHLRHIYEKCDVHSRAEILDLLESEKPTETAQGHGRSLDR